MARQETLRTNCNQCDGWYNSESELYDHMQTVHRRSVSQQRPVQPVRPERKNARTLIPIEELSPSPQEELLTVDRFILLASKSSVSDSLRLLPATSKALLIEHHGIKPLAQLHDWRGATSQVTPLGQL